LTYGILYEETFSKSAEVSVTGEELPVAPEYERVHFIGHALYNPGLSKEQLLGYAATLETEIERRTGYNAFLVDITIKHFAPVMTDVDFIIDVPTVKGLGTKKLSPIDPLTLIAIIAIIAAVLAFIIWLFWTTYIEKVKLYYCDQETPPTAYEGWLQYVAHLKAKHPTKYSAIEESKSKDWWTEIPETIKWVVGGAVAVAAIALVVELARRSK